jgi:intracellular multiplication protein IcmG
MADDEKINDEYQFTEVDPLNPPIEDEYSESEANAEPATQGMVAGESNIKRNAIVAVLGFILLMLLYKFVGSIFSSKHTATDDIKTPIATRARVVPPIEPQPIVEPAPSSIPPPAVMSSNVKSDIVSLQDGQENLSSQVSEVSGQVERTNTNIQTLTDKVTELNRVITVLNDKLEIQSHEIQRLSIRPVVKHVQPPRHRETVHFMKYYIQAVIPGRAWLVAENGRTMTIREGSTVPGYGLVRLIDPHQGRIMMSSGQIIRFSQEDS